jgi:hypothetical protein
MFSLQHRLYPKQQLSPTGQHLGPPAGLPQENDPEEHVSAELLPPSVPLHAFKDTTSKTLNTTAQINLLVLIIVSPFLSIHKI